MPQDADHPGRRVLATGVPIDCVNAPEAPATDYLMPGGLTLTELDELIRPLLAALGLAGLSLACYNPQKDYGGRGARDLVTLLRDVF